MGVSKRMDTFLQGLLDEKRSKDEEGNTMIDHMLSLQKALHLSFDLFFVSVTQVKPVSN
jgi:hypothetical protein